MALRFLNFMALALLVSPALVLTQESCFTPDNKPGYCVAPQECKYVLELTKKYGRFVPVSKRRELEAAVCNKSQRQMTLCCSTDSVMIDIEAQSQDKGQVETRASNPTGGNSNMNIGSIDPRGLRVLEGVECGKKPVIKLSGGDITQIGEFPWLALLKYNTAQQRPFLCGGSLISDRYVLTAAHCVHTHSKLIGVRLGEHDLSTEEDCQWKGKKRVCLPPYEEYGIASIKSHPQYVHGEIHHDLALIKLDRPVKQQIHIKPVCLPIDGQSQKVSYDQSYFIVGWGTTEKDSYKGSDVLLKAVVKRQELDVCRRFFQNAPVTENNICVLGSDIISTCRGDSGGPLFFRNSYKDTVRYVQYGVVSYGGRACGRRAAEPGVFANVIDMLPWITQNID
ncbi:serine protease grass [Scaptodrosophila lebanonensis]|uniref:CLIP domain-containing serine protease n=1 Tax=Drosophila lebanonensis TaxID=7225 RepID=A0A6J2T6N8_DROLE|nr:serine protease grass [Scaptodrosophila lebanonensis]